MSGTVTGLDLDRLEELAEKATGAPWEAKVYRFPNMAGPKWPEISGGRVLRDGGTMLVTDQVHYADDAEFIAEFRNAVPSLLAAARAACAVRLAVHLDDDDPINTREAEPRDDDWQRAAYEDGWDAAVDHMRGLVRAALGTEQEGRGE